MNYELGCDALVKVMKLIEQPGKHLAREQR
jgi:hypothetical protein